MRQYLYDMINSSGTLSTQDILIRIGMSILFGIVIFVSYRLTHEGSVYSAKFNITLLTLTILTTTVMTVIGNNVALSLGMVGALSIVRFRTAIKEPLDIAFLFWAIAEGIVLAAGMIPLAIIGGVVIGLILLVFVNKKSNYNPYIVVLQCDGHEAEQRTRQYLTEQTQRCVVKSKSAQHGAVELNLEIRLKNDNTDFINMLSEMEGVHSAVLVSYNGDYMG